VRLLTRRKGAAARFASAGQPADGTPWRQAPWCAVDLELTGLDPRRDEIVAIGAVPVTDGQLILGEAMYTLARADRPSESPAVLVHSLRSADLADAPPLSEAIDRLLDVLAGRGPVFHTARVEQTFLGRELRRRRLRLPRDVDTEQLGRAWLLARDGVAPPGLALGRLMALLGQPAEDPHHALGDALSTGKAFIALASHLDVARPQTVRSLQAVQDVAPATAQRMRPI
jgi:DNA polymerase-3 subunit epsilon